MTVSTVYDDPPSPGALPPESPIRVAMHRIAKGDKAAALAWLELVGSWPSEDKDTAAVTAAAERLLAR